MPLTHPLPAPTCGALAACRPHRPLLGDEEVELAAIDIENPEDGKMDVSALPGPAEPGLGTLSLLRWLNLRGTLIVQ